MQILQPGSKIGKYPIVRLIAAGGMGMLYEALHPVLGFQVAIKTIRPDLAHDRTVVDRFLNEAISACRVRDERLPRVHDHAVLSDGTPYMVMEYLEGEDLGHRLTRGALTPAVATRIVLEVLEVLDKVHRLGIIHRDIKPQNIFLARSSLTGEVPKLLDFGVAHIASDVMTRPGEVMGTPMYMALEQADGQGQVGPWTDVFAAGMVLYECFAGAGLRPWGAIPPMVYLQRLNERDAPIPLADLAADAPPGLADAVMRALTIDVDGRWPDAASFARAIEPFAQPRQVVFARTPGRPTAPPADPDAETAWGEARTPRRVSQSMNPAVVDQLRSRLAGIRRRPTRPSERIRFGERRHVTLLALTFELSANAGALYGPEAVDDVLHEIAAVIEQIIDEAGGRIEQHFGRSVLATFGYERTGEDDPERAALAALRVSESRMELDAALADIGYVVSLRIGLHAGFILHDRGAAPRTVTPVSGDTAAVVRFLESHAPINAIYASREMREAAGERFEWRDLGAHVMRNRSEPVDMFELVGLHEGRRFDRPDNRPFVGRAGALARLLGICSGTGRRVALLTAPPGFGKTRLMHEALRRLSAHTTPQHILYAEPALEEPYGLWARVMRQALDGMSIAALLAPEQLEHHDQVLQLLQGEGAVQPGQIGAPDVLKARIEQAVIAVLDARARIAMADTHRPLVIALDGLRRADEASLGLLKSLTAALGGAHAPVFLLAARTGELPDIDADRDEIALQPLSAPEVAKLARHLAPERRFSGAALRLIQARCGGCPLFIEELVASLAVAALNDADTGRLNAVRVPGSLYGMLLARLDRLPPRLRDVAQYVSVFGEQIWPEVWKAVASVATLGAGSSAPQAELNALADAGILDWRSEQGEVYFFFKQALLREAIYATVLPENRRLLHRLIAEAMVPDGRPPRILHHFHQAGVVDKTVAYARQVGRHALAIGAFDEAGRALQLAVQLQGQVPQMAAQDNAQTLLDLSWTLVYLGRLRDAADTARDAAVLAGDLALESMAGQACLASAQAAMLRHEAEEALSELELAEYRFERSGDFLMAARARSAQGFVLRKLGQPESGLPLVEEAWGVIRVHGQRSAVLRAAHDFGNVLLALQRPAEALQVFDEAVELADARNEAAAPGPAESWVEPAVRSARAIVCARLGRFDEAITAQTAVYDEGVAQGNRITQTLASFHLADHLLAAGRLDESERCAARAMELAGLLGMPERAIRARLILAQIADARGDADAMLEHLDAGEFLARTTINQEGGAADGLWFKIAERLVDRVERLGDLARGAALEAEARRRFADSAHPAIGAWLAQRDAVTPAP